MFSEKLQKILQLIKKTGDRVIVFDEAAPKDAYVLMDFESYADLIGEVAVAPRRPQVNQNKSNIQPSNTPHELSADSASDSYIGEEKNESILGLTEEDLTDKINREISVWKNQDNSAYLGEEIKSKRPWTIPPQVKDKAQVIE